MLSDFQRIVWWVRRKWTGFKIALLLSYKAFQVFVYATCPGLNLFGQSNDLRSLCLPLATRVSTLGTLLIERQFQH